MSEPFNTWQARFEKLRSNKLFEGVVISIIVISALVIGAKTYEETSRIEQWLLYLDVAVTVFFLVEILIRMAAERNLVSFFKKGWNVFDFLIVTASLIPMDDSEMVLLARLPMKMAVGTSLLIIAAKSLIGFLGDVGQQAIDWPFLALFTTLSVGGIFLGSYLTRYIAGEKLKMAFGWFVLGMAVFILWKEFV